ncbi:EscU/YscU/HrcU family type III secretion system export apparatus switch protein, partial [Herbaspirillum sp. RTI4]
MSSMKTELPTQKKLRDEAKKGKTFKAHDQIVAAVLIIGGAYLYWVFSLSTISNLLQATIASGFRIYPEEYFSELVWIFLKLVMPFIVICTIPIIVFSVWQSGFTLAFEALHPNISNLNPVNGFKKLFKIKTIKDTFKALLYLPVVFVSGYVFWKIYQEWIFSQIYM